MTVIMFTAGYCCCVAFVSPALFWPGAIMFVAAVLAYVADEVLG